MTLKSLLPPFVLAMFLVAVACSSRHMPDPRFALLDSLAFNVPDSALVLLQAYDDAPEGTSFGRKPMDKAGRMHIELMRGVAMNRAWVDFTTDSVMLEVADHYRRHGSRNEQLLSLYILGCTYRDLGNAPRAIDTWLQAAAAADTTASDCDWATLMRVHSQMGEAYRKQRLYARAAESFRIAKRYSNAIGDTLSAMIFEIDFCHLLFNDGRLQECIQEASRIYDDHMKRGYDDYAASVCIIAAKAALEQKDYALMKQSLDLYQKNLSQKIDRAHITGGASALFLYKGYYYLGIGNNDSAEICLNSVHADPSQPSIELIKNHGLAHLYAQKKQNDSIVKYMNLYAEAKEKDFDYRIAEAAIVAEQLYDYSSEQAIAARKSEENARLKVWLISTLLLTLVSTLLFLLYRERKKRRIAELLREYEQAVRENDSMRITITQMSHKIQSGDQYMVDLFQRYEDQNKRIESLNRRLSVLLPRRKNVILDDTGIVHRINIYLYKHDQTMSEQDWEEFRHAVNESYPFLDEKLETLVHLSLNEYRVCLLDLAGFSSKESDILLGQAFSYTSKTKQRILKKLFGKQLSATEFSKRIRRL